MKKIWFFLGINIASLLIFYPIIKINQLKNYYKKYIENFGYKLEEYDVKTEDGYILSLWHLIPNSGKSSDKVIFMQPGVLCDGTTFFHLEEESLPFLLSENGFDVWVGSTRGTEFSSKHEYLDSNKFDSDYWDFSLDDSAEYDLPASINYIKEKTGVSKINYLAHSMGTIIFYMLYSRNPTFIESSIEKFVALGSVFNLYHSKISIFDFINKINGFLQINILKGYKPTARQRYKLAKFFKYETGLFQKFIEDTFNLRSTNNINYSTFYKFFYYYPGGTSKNIILQFDQIHKDKKLEYFNSNKNNEPKEYDMSFIKNWNIKTFLQRSDADSMSTYEDVTELYESFGDKSLITLYDTPNYGHLDFYASETAVDDLYLPIIKFLNN